jgi:hypothetical protein
VTAKLDLLVPVLLGAASEASVLVVAGTWTLSLPLFAPFGTVATMLVSDLIAHFVAVTVPNLTKPTGLGEPATEVTPLGPRKLVPVIVTLVPILPLFGVKFVIVGSPFALLAAKAVPLETRAERIRTVTASEIHRYRIRDVSLFGLRIACLRSSVVLSTDITLQLARLAARKPFAHRN